MLRASLLKNGKILAEYDFCLKRTLNRQKALSKQVLSETFEKTLMSQNHKKHQIHNKYSLHFTFRPPL